jgi:hypothetical protein
MTPSGIPHVNCGHSGGQKEGKSEMPARPSPSPDNANRPANKKPIGSALAMGITGTDNGPQGVHPQLGGGVRFPTGLLI